MTILPAFTLQQSQFCLILRRRCPLFGQLCCMCSIPDLADTTFVAAPQQG
jgi:hypothetical protein